MKALSVTQKLTIINKNVKYDIGLPVYPDDNNLIYGNIELNNCIYQIYYYGDYVNIIVCPMEGDDEWVHDNFIIEHITV